jgi:hypothetical protein
VDVNIFLEKKFKKIILRVFWDLYAAAPERRDKYEHSQEAKAFHDYVNFI